jgi:hypothetical protein
VGEYVNLNVDSAASLEVGTAGGAAAGSITIDSGVHVSEAGIWTASSIVDNGDLTVAAHDQLSLNGSLSGSGRIHISEGADLIIGSASNNFAPVISGLAADNAIDYEGTVTGVIYNSTGVHIGTLTLKDGATTVATFTLAGNYAGDTFYAVTPNFSNETQIGVLGAGDTNSPPEGTGAANNYVWTAPVAGSWDLASNWEDMTAHQNPAHVAPGSQDDVTIDATDNGIVHVINGVGDSASLTIKGTTDLAGNFTTGTLVLVGGGLTVAGGDGLTVTGDANVSIIPSRSMAR